MPWIQKPCQVEPPAECRRFTVRVSSLPAFSICPGFNQPQPGVKLTEDHSKPAEQGSAGHAAIEVLLRDGIDPDFNLIALEFPSVDVDDLRICYYMARRLWSSGMLPHFSGDGRGIPLLGPGVGAPTATHPGMVAPLRDSSRDSLVVEEYLEARLGTVTIKATGEDADVWLTGHKDVTYRTPDNVYIWDWKFGRELGKSHLWQTGGYAALEVLCNGWPKSGTITVGESHVRQDIWDEHTQVIDRDYLTAFKTVVLAQVAAYGTTVATPDSCKFCKLATTCEDYPKLYEKAYRQLGHLIKDESAVGCGDKVGELFEASKLLEYAVKDYKELLKAHLKTTGATSKDAAVGGFYLKPTAKREVLLDSPPLLAAIGVDGVDSLRGKKATLTKVLKEAAKTAPVGTTKKAHKEKLEASLRASGALLESETLSPAKV